MKKATKILKYLETICLSLFLFKKVKVTQSMPVNFYLRNNKDGQHEIYASPARYTKKNVGPLTESPPPDVATMADAKAGTSPNVVTAEFPTPIVSDSFTVVGELINGTPVLVFFFISSLQRKS
jgi:hypothetical protein